MVENSEQNRRASIVPTVTAFSIEEYNQQLAKIKFAQRLHLDFTDGELAPSRTINLVEAHWPPEATVDIHLMYKHPAQQLESLISMGPNLVILHAEAGDSLSELFTQLKAVGIKTGLAILADTTVESQTEHIKNVDHLLVFGGRLGYQGSELQAQHLTKIRQAKDIKPELEVGWDGGVNDANVAEVAAAGADIINVGGFLQTAEEPKKAYAKLKQIAEEVGNDRPGT